MTLSLPFREPSDLPLAVAAAREQLDASGVVVLPTETFYGLAARPERADAVGEVFRIKGRGADKALPVAGASLAELASLVVIPPLWAERLNEVWPAPLTVVFPVRRPLAAGPGGTLAVRVPAHGLLRALLARLGPLTVTSANRSGDAPESEPDAVVRVLAGVELVLDGGSTPGGSASTLVDATSTPPRLLRAGPFALPGGWNVKTV